jgi:hypothetical protein
MSRKSVRWLAALLICSGLSCGSSETPRAETQQPGLVGAWYSRKDFRNIKQMELIRTLELSAEAEDSSVLRGDRGEGWAAQWEGFILGPAGQCP